MTRKILRAFACVFTLIVIAAAMPAAGASANPGDPPEAWNTVTGWDSLQPGPFQHNWDEAAVGDGLEAQSNDWANPAYSYTSSWQRCIDTAANGCVAISGATTTSYTLTAFDVGNTFRFCSTASTGATMCTITTKKVVQTHTDTDGDGVLDFRDSCYQQTGLPPGCPDFAHQPTLTNATTGGDVDSEVAANDLLQGDTSAWKEGQPPFTYEFRGCFDGWCAQGSWLIRATTDPSYHARFEDYGQYIQFCAIDARGVRMCSKGAGTPGGVLGAHTDTDKDGVADYRDDCASTPALSPDGCPVPQPATPASAAVPVETPKGQEPAPAQAAAPPAPAPSANGVGATRAAQLSALINNRSRALKLGFGKRSTVTGRLADTSGRPIAGAELVLLTKGTAATAKFAKLTTVRTDASGRFSYVAPAGSSRILRVEYYAFEGDTAVADAADVTLLVSGALTLKAPRRVANRHAATFRGRLRGKPVPNAGVLVDLQVWFRKKWRTFATPRTNVKGAFKYSYRFTQGAAAWRFRARIRKDSLYPYELAYSRVLGVRVTG